MQDDLQTNDTDASAGKVDVSSELSLSQLNEITGREFKGLDDFKKHYKNLSSLVGKKDEAKDKLNSILAKAEPYAAKYGLTSGDFLEYYLTNPTATEDDIRGHFNKQEVSKERKKETEYHTKVKKLEFLVEHPDAKEDYGLVSALAKGMGVSLEEAYESPEYKKVVNASRATKGTSVINSNSKIVTSDSELNRLKEDVIKSKGRTDVLARYIQELGVVEK